MNEKKKSLRNLEAKIKLIELKTLHIVLVSLSEVLTSTLLC